MVWILWLRPLDQRPPPFPSEGTMGEFFFSLSFTVLHLRKWRGKKNFVGTLWSTKVDWCEDPKAVAGTKSELPRWYLLLLTTKCSILWELVLPGRVRLLGFRNETGFDVLDAAQWGSKCWMLEVESSVSKGLCFFNPHWLSLHRCQAPSSVLVWDREAWCYGNIWNILDPNFEKEMKMENGYKESSVRTIVNVTSLGLPQGDYQTNFFSKPLRNSSFEWIF